MFKFIATDLDGTLLTEDKRVPPEIFELIPRLYARGILFAPASGRQYANLLALFAPVKDQVLFICENGALIKYRGKTLHIDPIDDGYLPRVLAEIRALPHLYPLLCGEHTAYLEDDFKPFYDFSMSAYTHCEKVPSLDGVIGRERILKVAVYDAVGAAENCIRNLPARLPALRTAISGEEWCDVTAPDAHKGAAIRVIRERMGLKREECLAFGDHMNDFEMLSECGTAYVPANAYPPLKEQFPVIPANGEGGVVMKLRELLSAGCPRKENQS